MTGILAELIPAVGEVATAFLSTLGNVFDGVFSLVWQTGTDGGTMTTLGWFLAIPVGIALAYYGIGFVVKLINKLKPSKN